MSTLVKLLSQLCKRVHYGNGKFLYKQQGH